MIKKLKETIFNQNRVSKTWRSSFNSSQKSLGLKESDIFLVSFPRSGNTLVRAILAYILYSKEDLNSLKDLNYFVPDLHKGIPDHNHYSKPRIVKTHRSYPFRHARTNQKLYSRIIYLVRHPINLITSLHEYRNKLKLKNTIDQTIMEVITSNNPWGGSWQEHILSWKAQENNIDILFIKYEELQENKLKTIQKIADFVGYHLSLEQIHEISSLTSKEAMKAMEKKGRLN